MEVERRDPLENYKLVLASAMGLRRVNAQKREVGVEGFSYGRNS